MGQCFSDPSDRKQKPQPPASIPTPTPARTNGYTGGANTLADSSQLGGKEDNAREAAAKAAEERAKAVSFFSLLPSHLPFG